MRLSIDMKRKFLQFLYPALLLLNACTAPRDLVLPIDRSLPTQSISNENKKPRNIILMIGDGMGLTQTTAAMFSNGNQLQLERCPVVGIHKPYAADDLITDSAAGATAFSIGKKTKNGYLGLDSLGISCETIMEEASRKKMATGLIVTSTIVHATPASFFAHHKDRDQYEDIALHMLQSDFNLYIGGGKKYFDRRNNDQRNLVEELKEKSYLVSDYFQQDLEHWSLPAVDKICFFTADGDPLPCNAGRSYLPRATKEGIRYLNGASEKGFLLMVEGSQIDWGGHSNDAAYIISEMLDFDKAIQQALDFAEHDKNTLVIITADHETGGMAINKGKKFDNLVSAFTTTKHSADLIPVYAFGPGSELFSGIYENTAIYNKMKNLLFSR